MPRCVARVQHLRSGSFQWQNHDCLTLRVSTFSFHNFLPVKKQRGRQIVLL
jgi:hypothetical protein